jgi:hypothetical protein
MEYRAAAQPAMRRAAIRRGAIEYAPVRAEHHSGARVCAVVRASSEAVDGTFGPKAGARGCQFTHRAFPILAAFPRSTVERAGAAIMTP